MLVFYLFTMSSVASGKSRSHDFPNQYSYAKISDEKRLRAADGKPEKNDVDGSNKLPDSTCLMGGFSSTYSETMKKSIKRGWWRGGSSYVTFESPGGKTIPIGRVRSRLIAASGSANVDDSKKSTNEGSSSKEQSMKHVSMN